MAAGRAHIVVQLDRAEASVEDSFSGDMSAMSDSYYFQGLAPAKIYTAAGTLVSGSFSGGKRMELVPPSSSLSYDDGINSETEYWVVREDLGEPNMDSGATIAAFTTWALTNYPAERRMLDLWDHGMGVLGFGGDAHGEDSNGAAAASVWAAALPVVIDGISAGLSNGADSIFVEALCP